MRRIAILLLLLTASTAAKADNCGKSREYLLGSLAGELPMPAQSYEALFKTCMAASAMSNVKDAYMLKDGGIAVVPKQDSISATAATLSQFCNAYPRATLRFITRKELALSKSTLAIVRMSSGSATSCKKIMGG
ncbi:hypothetical protein [Tardiphaga sp.]|uniref:hypothetical protein n=1 Tax=Tardiphaga sp. TaxID=1926292 RepID=UPI00263825D8|nr:hypothetical protein [Tardiphaga sp.]MDB5616832.1 hypothetical protein [Tardiphaga sp.]